MSLNSAGEPDMEIKFFHAWLFLFDFFQERRSENMERANLKIREAILRRGLCHYQVAEQAGISPSTLCVWLRTPLSEERERRIIEAIKKCK